MQSGQADEKIFALPETKFMEINAKDNNWMYLVRDEHL